MEDGELAMGDRWFGRTSNIEHPTSNVESSVIREGWLGIHHCTMYGVTNLVTEVTKRVTHQR